MCGVINGGMGKESSCSHSEIMSLNRNGDLSCVAKNVVVTLEHSRIRWYGGRTKKFVTNYLMILIINF
jgi:hypothetical protein